MALKLVKDGFCNRALFCFGLLEKKPRALQLRGVRCVLLREAVHFDQHWTTKMPKLLPDERLVERVRAFVERRGTVASAASALGVDRTFLWRFQRSGRAIGRTRARLADALARLEKETKSEESATTTLGTQLPVGVSAKDLVAMRAFFQNMLNVIDAYAANPSSAAAMAELTGMVAGVTAEQSDRTLEEDGRDGQS
ncbi:hypothetical protein PQQ81_31865 [Paraburkholderia strydomiana]|uniref:hypothetical protein n=1 Tax=Paraburkholderia strydomiana TaxID=1245417 RepID=UPI0038BB779A